MNWKGREISRWPSRILAQAKRMAVAELNGVGDPSIQQLWHDKKRGASVHFRRLLSASEVATLSEAWCAIPATDGHAGDASKHPRRRRRRTR